MQTVGFALLALRDNCDASGGPQYLESLVALVDSQPGRAIQNTRVVLEWLSKSVEAPAEVPGCSVAVWPEHHDDPKVIDDMMNAIGPV